MPKAKAPKQPARFKTGERIIHKFRGSGTFQKYRPDGLTCFVYLDERGAEPVAAELKYLTPLVKP